MRIEQNQKMDANVVVTGNARQDNVAAAKKDASIVRIEKDRKADRLLEQPTYGKPEKEENALEKIKEQASNLDATQMKNEMLFASDHTTGKDVKAMEEDGFSLTDTEIPTVVTETDKMKMRLAKSGEDISYFGDGLSDAQIEAMAGSTAMAQHIESALNTVNIPVTENNVKDITETANMMEELHTPDEGSMKYMLDNELPVTTANLYKAEFSGSATYAGMQQMTDLDYDALKQQIEAVISESGMDVNEQNMADGRWLIENGIPLTAENLEKLSTLQQLQLPLGEEEIVAVSAEAISDGIRPQDVVLSGNDFKDQAQDALDVITNVTDEELAYVVNSGEPLTIENLKKAADEIKNKDTKVSAAADKTAYTKSGLDLLTARRQLEETRLKMTSEANLSLLKKGISIDTMELSQLVEELKTQENEYYSRLLSGDGIAPKEADVALFRNVMDTSEALKAMPAYALGIHPVDETTLQSLYEDGAALKDTFEKAGERYETMMTAPRQDMGDSISKAFRNVDDILKDLGLETSYGNQRAVRILAYNQMELTPENIAEMKAADEEVQRAFDHLKPAVVRTMIKEGMNPLDMSFEEINTVSEQIQEEQGITEEEKFSKYLYKLEQNKEISEEERSAYIGVYRLIRQVEKTDGAAIGALLQQGGDITLRGLLTQVRSAKHGAMDYQVDDDFGGVQTKEGAGISITEQIEGAYQKNRLSDVKDGLVPEKIAPFMEDEKWLSMTPEELADAMKEVEQKEETEAAYRKEQVQELSRAAAAPQEVYEWLEQLDMPATVNRVLAAADYMNNRNQVFNRLFKMADRSENLSEELENIKEKIFSDFAEAVKTPKEMAEAQRKLADTAENVMKTMMMSEDNLTSLDLQELKMMHTQIALGSAAAKKEEYAVPVLVQGETCNVSLKIVRGEEKKGLVDVVFETDRLGRVAAQLRAGKEKISGYIAAESKETTALFESHAKEWENLFAQEPGQEVSISYMTGEIKKDGIHHSTEVSSENTDKTEEKNPSDTEIQTKTLYGMAESFLKAVKSLERSSDIQYIRHGTSIDRKDAGMNGRKELR